MTSSLIRRAMSGAAVVVAFAAIGGCASSLRHGIRPLHPLEVATSPYDGTLATTLDGSLMYEGGCLLLRAEPSGYVLPVWPDGSIFNGTSVIFHQPGKANQPIMVAQQIELQGRTVAWNQLPGFEPFAYHCPAQPFLVSKVRPAD